MLYFDTTNSGATFSYSVPSLSYDVTNVATEGSSGYWKYELDKYKFIIPFYKAAIDDYELEVVADSTFRAYADADAPTI